MRVVVTGAGGLLGSTIVDVFRAADDEVHALDHAALDIVDGAAVTRVTEQLRPDAIINCSAYNDVDAAEGDPLAALQVNAMGVLGLARAAKAVGAALVHYSTDFVFDGVSSRPYTENDAPNPQSVYGASKLLGEWFAAEAARHYVLRVESLFGPAAADRPTRRGSLGTIVDRIRSGEPVPVFVDRTVSPSYTPDIAAVTRRLLAAAAPEGLYHCVNDGAGTWLEVAQEAAAVLGAPLQPRPLTLDAVSLKARRPRFCAMSPAKLAGLGIVMPSWRDAIRRYLTAGT
jgi:dTDP-4-dehydrorhamnose reductase